MRIESGTTFEKKTRQLVFAVLCIGVGGWFAYDGWVGYERQNLAALRRLVPADQTDKVRMDPKVTADLAGKSVAEVRAVVGYDPPIVVNDEARYFGIDGHLSIPTVGGKAAWVRAKHSSTDIAGQKLLGVVVTLLGLVLLVNVVRITSRRVVLDDAGLDLGRGRVIRWEDMTGLDSSQYERKGWVTLRHGGGAACRLDSYDLAAFDAIVDEICRRKGFDNPLPAEPSEPPSAAGPRGGTAS